MIVATIIGVELGALSISAPVGKRYNQKEFRNKFNGKLVMRWTGLGPGPMLAETIEEFYVYVEKTLGFEFPEYMLTATPSIVRSDFLGFYDPLGHIFD